MDYGETEEVQATHAAIQREKREPRAGLEPLSLWLIALYGLAIFFGGAYLGRYSGNFSGDGLDPLGGANRRRNMDREAEARRKPRSSLRPSAVKRFSRPIARPAIK